jgi:hypothetical protein
MDALNSRRRAWLPAFWCRRSNVANRLYPMRELLGDMLFEQQQPALALKEYETSFETTPNRLRGLYGAAKAAELAKVQDKATTYFRKLSELTKDADTP